MEKETTTTVGTEKIETVTVGMTKATDSLITEMAHLAEAEAEMIIMVETEIITAEIILDHHIIKTREGTTKKETGLTSHTTIKTTMPIGKKEKITVREKNSVSNSDQA